jgi:LDH2 family malate/lactate/ureidoglycolate dehydrogenase
MFKRFRIPLEDQVFIDAETLHRTVAAVFTALGVPEEDARLGADHLINNDLRGIESHGVSNKLRDYVRDYRAGILNPAPSWRVVHETGGTATVDGDAALGIIIGRPMMALAIEKAQVNGIGMVTVRNSGHLGAIGAFAYQAAEAGCVGLCFSSAGFFVAPTYGAEARLGTNPLAVAAPSRQRPFFLFDAATSTVANNKVQLARRLDVPLAAGWVADEDGVPLMEEAPPPDSLTLLPLGSIREMGSHKGYGLGMMVEVLTTLLSGSLPAMLEPTPLMRHAFIALDIAAFTEPDAFLDTMDRMLEELLETPSAPGHPAVIYPGWPESQCEEERRAHGIPLHREVIAWFDQVTGELGVPGLNRP